MPVDRCGGLTLLIFDVHDRRTFESMIIAVIAVGCLRRLVHKYKLDGITNF